MEAREGEGDLRALLAVALRSLSLFDTGALCKGELLSTDDRSRARL